MSLKDLWRRLTGERRARRVVRSPDDLDRLAAPEPRPSAPPELASPALPRSPDHDLRLIQFAPDSQARTLPEQRRLLEILDLLGRHPEAAARVSGDEVLELCDRLTEAGELRRAIELLRQLSGHVPGQPRLKLRLGELLYEARDLQPALEILRQLVEEPTCRLRAHFLLGDHFSREADLERALTHYEAVVAIDATTPRARQRARELRGRLDRPLATAAPTLFGGDEIGPGSRFVLQRELGRGGSGTVYLALDRQLRRRVAVKALHRRVRERPDARTHLFCEARIATALQDPGIVAVYDLDEQLDLVVMEYCAGGTLAEHLARGALPLELALRRLAEVAAVLDRVHRRGIVHRDLKPANLLSREPRDAGLAPLVITDFGIAHVDREEEPEPAAAAGSLIYMAPEQQRGEAPEPRSDLYSCGVILLEMLLGRPPIDGAKALLGVPLLEISELWREVADLAPPSLRETLLRLCQSLVSPLAQQRPDGAAALATATLGLCRSLAQLDERRPIAEELRRRAGPPPHSPAVARWLSQQLAALEE